MRAPPSSWRYDRDRRRPHASTAASFPCAPEGASVSGPETFVEGRREILRQASVALGGRPVTVWEVSAGAELEPQASSDPTPGYHDSKLDVDATLRHWGIHIVQGSRFVGARAGEGHWVVAPLRSRPPAPPPEGRERRSRERLTLELAGLCLGLLDRREVPATPFAKHADPLQDLATLPGIIAHEVSNPLTAARAGLQLAMEALGRWTQVAAARRLEMLTSSARWSTTSTAASTSCAPSRTAPAARWRARSGSTPCAWSAPAARSRAACSGIRSSPWSSIPRSTRSISRAIPTRSTTCW